MNPLENRARKNRQKNAQEKKDNVEVHLIFLAFVPIMLGLYLNIDEDLAIGKLAASFVAPFIFMMAASVTGDLLPWKTPWKLSLVLFSSVWCTYFWFYSAFPFFAFSIIPVLWGLLMYNRQAILDESED